MARPVPFQDPNRSFPQCGSLEFTQTGQNFQQQQQQQQPGFYNQNLTEQNQWTDFQQDSMQSQQRQQQQFQQTHAQGMQYGGHPSQGLGGDMLNQISANNPMAGFAIGQATSFLSDHSKRYMPGVSGFWNSLKYYFAVNNSYVLNKLKILLLPFRHKSWRRYDNDNPASYGGKGRNMPPCNDVNAPDLYIPLMGYVTYVLIVGYVKGSSGEFSPDVIGEVASYCLIMQLLEIGMIKSVLYMLACQMTFLDLVAFTGYKYVSLVINMSFGILFGKLMYYGSLSYTGIMISYFILNVMKCALPDGLQHARKKRNYMLFGIAALQLALIWWMAYTGDW